MNENNMVFEARITFKNGVVRTIGRTFDKDVSPERASLILAECLEIAEDMEDEEVTND